jgi:hypothetical protein
MLVVICELPHVNVPPGGFTVAVKVADCPEHIVGELKLAVGV